MGVRLPSVSTSVVPSLGGRVNEEVPTMEVMSRWPR